MMGGVGIGALGEAPGVRCSANLRNWCSVIRCVAPPHVRRCHLADEALCGPSKRDAS